MSKSKVQLEKELEARNSQLAAQQNMLLVMEQELVRVRARLQQNTLFELDARRRLENCRDLLDASQERVRELTASLAPVSPGPSGV